MTHDTQASDRKDQIAGALWRVVVRDGAPRASLRAIAREAGCTTGVLTHHFASKKDLVEYSASRLIDDTIARVTRAAQAGLAAGMAELLPLDEHRRDEARLWTTVLGWSSTDQHLAEQLAKGHRAIRRHIAEVAQKAHPALPRDEANDLAYQILAVVDGLTIGALTNPSDYPAARQRELLRASITALGPVP